MKQQAFQRSLLAWYDRNKRSLPWRKTHNPYRIWLSEIMLQQTQVKTVIPYYHRFLAAFPTVHKLAAAPLERVLKLWEGLGYYSRARNLHRAAHVVVCAFSGQFPREVEALQRLPGVGRYTAGAIASIAFGVRAPIVDRNVERVLCRYLAIVEDPRRPEVKQRLWQLAGDLLPSSPGNRSPARVGDFNQAMMELGALVCVPDEPDCHCCPVRKTCAAYRLGKVDQLPMRPPHARVPVRKKVACMLMSGDFPSGGGVLLLRKRPPQGLLGGLWEIPLLEKIDVAALRLRPWPQLREHLGLSVKNGNGHPIPVRGGPVSHQYTHFKEVVTPYQFSFRPKAVPSVKNHGQPYRWVTATDIHHLPLTKIAHKLLQTI